MIPELSLTGSIGWGLLLAPLVVLLATALLTQWSWGSAKAAAHHGVNRAQQTPSGPLTAPSSGAGSQEGVLAREGSAIAEPSLLVAGHADTAEPGGTFEQDPGPDVSGTTETGEHQRQSAISALGGQPRDVERAATVRRVFAVRELIADAEKTGDRKELAKLCLSQARYLREGGEIREAGDLARKCILIAIEMRDDHLHAQGRLELGDIAESLGDLTTACEHWQMARSLFTDVDEHQRSEAAEQRMLKRGCPTDWVLTDF